MGKGKGINIINKDGRRVVQGLGYHKPRPVEDLREVIKGSVDKYGDGEAFKFRNSEGMITGKTYREFDRDIDCLGTSLMALGLKGARIAILSENRYEWGVSYFSVVNGVGVVVPLDKYLPQNEVENLIDRGGVETIFYSHPFHSMMKEISRSSSRIRYFICMDELENPDKEDPRFITMPELVESGEILLKSGDTSFVEAPIDREKMSILLFTSGTTSMAKGVMLSHSNIASNVTGITSIIYAGPGDVHLSLLPLHHTFESTIGLIHMVHCGVCIAYGDGIRHIAQNLKEFGITVLVAVPAIMEAIYKKVKEGVKKSGKERLFNTIVIISEVLRKAGIDLRKKLFKSIFNQFGPSLRLAVSGAAPLDPEVIIGFDKIGLKLLEGYGLTETSPVLSANNDFVIKPGTVGHPMAGIEISIDSPDEDGIGEIIARGSNIMLGYYENPDSTAEVMEADGWFRTGDLGIIDEDGFIKITGRAKSMIVLTNGKKAFPEEYEVLLNNIPGIKESLVWGNSASDGDIHVCAKLILDREQLVDDNGDTLSEAELAAMFDAKIKEINKTMPQYKMIRYFVMSFEDLAKTTTLKIKRHIEHDKIIDELDKAGLDIRKASGRLMETLGDH